MDKIRQCIFNCIYFILKISSFTIKQKVLHLITFNLPVYDIYPSSIPNPSFFLINILEGLKNYEYFTLFLRLK